MCFRILIRSHDLDYPNSPGFIAPRNITPIGITYPILRLILGVKLPHHPSLTLGRENALDGVADLKFFHHGSKSNAKGLANRNLVCSHPPTYP